MDNIKLLAKQIKNQKAKEWRDKNKDKVREINKRYWEKKAIEYLEKEGVKNDKRKK